MTGLDRRYQAYPDVDPEPVAMRRVGAFLVGTLLVFLLLAIAAQAGLIK